MEMNSRRYPIGIQNFEQLRNLNRVYVDKTELIYRLIKTDQIYFFSRPRRFGKICLCPHSKLTFGEEGAFPRSGYGAVGARLDGLPCITYRLQFNKIYRTI